MSGGTNVRDDGHGSDTTEPRLELRPDGSPQVADTHPLDTDRPGAAPPTAPRRGGFGRAIGTVVLVFVVLAFVAMLLIARFVADFNPFDRETIDRTQPAVLLALQDLSEYRAATGEFQVIVDSEESVPNLPRQIAGERTLFVAVGTVDAAVDFSDLDEDAIAVDEARERASITLPAAELTDAVVDPDRSYVFSRERGLLDRLAGLFNDNPTSERPLYQIAERRLARAAAEGGLVVLANRNTELMLRSLLTSLGFTEVEVTFE